MKARDFLKRIFLSTLAASLLLGSFSVADAKAVTNVISPSTSPAVKKSLYNLCHAKGSKYYDQTKYFKAYPNVVACLASGGKLPKR